VCPGHPWNTGFALPGVVLSSELAELRALLHAVEGASALQVDITVKLDNQFVADTASAVLAGSKSWPANGHDLWRRLSVAQQAQISSGCDGHSASWIKGHATLQDVDLGIITAEERFGNSEADKLASKAASICLCPRDLVEGLSQREEQAELVQRYLVEVLLTRLLLLLPPKDDNATAIAPVLTSHDGLFLPSDAMAVKEAFEALHHF
jgi:ribonuclease HI